MFEFQILTSTGEDAERFMEEIGAEDVSIEDWSGSRPGKEYENYFCSFGLTNLTPKKLNRVADILGVALIYVEQDD
jgi:hypothetical protein